MRAPDVVYVPQYDPWLVYGAPLGVWPGWCAYPGLYLAGAGIAFGNFSSPLFVSTRQAAGADGQYPSDGWESGYNSVLEKVSLIIYSP